jgi:hypothetical protein
MMTDPIIAQYCIALFRRVILQRDKQARKAVRQRFTETVRDWLHRHPSREMVYSPGSEEQYVAEVFAQCWQTADDSSQHKGCSRRPNKEKKITPAALFFEQFMIENLYFEALLR